MNWKLRLAMAAVFNEGEGGAAGGASGAGTTAAAGAVATLTEDKSGGAAPAAGAAPGAAAPAAGAASWYDGFKDVETKDWLKAYNNAYPDPESVAKKAMHLERFVSAEKAGRGVIIPKADAKPEEWAAFTKKVYGVPDTPEGYKMPATIKAEVAADLAKDPMLKGFQAQAHKMGLPPKMYDEVMSWYAEQASNLGANSVRDFEAKVAGEMATLRNEWAGPKWDENVESARRALRAFLPAKDKTERDEKVNKIMGALGVAETYKLFAAIGKSVGEHAYTDGEGRGGDGSMTPEAARLKIEMLKKDKEFGAKLLSKDSNTVAEWDMLNKLAAQAGSKGA